MDIRRLIKIFQENLYLCGLFVFSIILGSTNRFTHQDVLYNAQIVSGQVKYHSQDVLAQWGHALWSIWVQLSAVFLKLGISEASQSYFFSILIIFISLWAIFNIAISFQYSPQKAFLLALIIFYFKFYLWGFGYEIALTSWEYFNPTLGLLGFQFGVLTISFFYLKQYKTAYLLLGLLFCVHPVFSLLPILWWFSVLLFRKDPFLLKPFLVGIVIALSSLVVHLYLRPKVPFIEFNLNLESFIKNWDMHRGINLYQNYLPFAIFLFLNIYMFFQKSCLNKLYTFTLALVSFVLFSCISVLISTGIYFEHNLILMLMPEKLLNYPYYFSGVFLIILLLQKRSLFFLTCALLLIFLLDALFSFAFWSHYSLVIFGAFFFYNILREKYKSINYKKVNKYFTPLVLVIIISTEVQTPRVTNYQLVQNSILTKKLDGYVLLSPLHKGSYIQYLSKNKILFDPTELSDIPYSTSSANLSFDIMHNIYGINLRKNFYGMNLGNNEWIYWVKNTWQNRNLNKWKELARNYNFQYIIVPIDWDIQGKLIAEDGKQKIIKI